MIQFSLVDLMKQLSTVKNKDDYYAVQQKFEGQKSSIKNENDEMLGTLLVRCQIRFESLEEEEELRVLKAPEPMYAFAEMRHSNTNSTVFFGFPNTKNEKAVYILIGDAYVVLKVANNIENFLSGVWNDDAYVRTVVPN